MNKHIESKLKEFEEGLYEEFWKEGRMSATDFAKDFLQKALKDTYQQGVACGMEEKNKVPVTCNNLMWSEVAPQQMGWKEAMKYAEDLEEGGYSDWRLPTVSELQQVFDYEKGETKIEFDPANYFWSSTEYYNDQSYAWSVYLHYGYTYYTTKVTAFYVRCVRRE